MCNFWENRDFIEKKIVKKLIFFLAILKFLMAPLDAQQNFMLMKYNFFFFLSLLDQKLYRFFVKNLPKLNILSVIAIDLVKIFKQTKNHLAHFIKVE